MVKNWSFTVKNTGGQFFPEKTILALEEFNMQIDPFELRVPALAPGQ